jgi:hypothetical protein
MISTVKVWWKGKGVLKIALGWLRFEVNMSLSFENELSFI